MTEKFIGAVSSFFDAMFTPFFQWERLRHPWAGWARIGLLLLFPFILWSHDWLLVILWGMAVFSHPYWFPSCVDAGDDRHLFTKATDAVQDWMGDAPVDKKLMAFFPCTVMFLPMALSLWDHNLFWGVYFLAAIISHKILFIRAILQEHTK